MLTVVLGLLEPWGVLCTTQIVLHTTMPVHGKKDLSLS